MLSDLVLSLVRSRLRFFHSFTKDCHQIMSFSRSYLEIKDLPSHFSALNESVCCQACFPFSSQALIGTLSKGMPCTLCLWSEFLYSEVYMQLCFEQSDVSVSLHCFCLCQHTLLCATMKIRFLCSRQNEKLIYSSRHFSNLS